MKGIKTVLIGAGYRGQRLLRLMQGIEAYNVTAVFDLRLCFILTGCWKYIPKVLKTINE